MHLQFTGLRSAYPVYVYVIILLGIIVLAVLSYRSVKSLTGSQKGLLIVLRSSALFILVLLLLNPVFRMTSTVRQKRNLAVLIDNSKSLSLVKGSYLGLQSYDSVLSVISHIDTNHVHLNYFTFGSHVTPVRKPRLSLSESATNISNPLYAIQHSDTSYAAIILLSDGIYNNGEDPKYLKPDIPVYAIALGDTTTVPDLLVNDLSAPGTAYLGKSMTVTAGIEHTGYTGMTIPVQLLHSNHVVAQRKIHLTGSRGISEVSFIFKPREMGIQTYRIHIPAVPHEWNVNNNDRYFHLNVQNNQIRVVHIAFEVHPDVKAIRSALRSNPRVKLYTINLIDKNTLSHTTSLPGMDSTDVVILQGFPQKGTPVKQLHRIVDWLSGKPFMLIITPNTNIGKLNTVFQNKLPFVTDGGQWQPIDELHVTGQADMFPVIRNLTFPPEAMPGGIFAWQGNLLPVPDARILLAAGLMRNTREIPVLAVVNNNNRRISELMLTGFYRLQQASVPAYRNSLKKLVTQILFWTASNTHGHLMQVKPGQVDFPDANNITFSADLQDQSGQPVNNAQIQIQIAGRNGKKNFDMSSENEGQYKLNAGLMSAGVYHYRAIAKLNNAILDSAKGDFSVTATNLEYLNTRRDDRLLKSLASQSGGVYLAFNEAGTLPDSLQKAGLLNPAMVQKDRDIYLYRYPWWLLTVVILLSVEWILRRKHSLP